jgi:HEAT repeat protein
MTLPTRVILIFALIASARSLFGSSPTFSEAAAYVSRPENGFANMSPFELQVKYRICGVGGQLQYKFTESDRPLWRKLLNDPNQSVYTRLCAAYFLLDQDHDAQELIRAQLDSHDLRHRYNAAEILALYLAANSKSKMLDLLLPRLANGSLDDSGVRSSPDGSFPEGDRDDIMYSPAMDICLIFGNTKCDRAAPALISGVNRQAPWSKFAIIALAEIGDPAAIPTLLKQAQKEDTVELNRAFGLLKCKEAVPLMSQNLSKSSVYPTEADQAILEAFGAIGDPTAIDSVKQFLHQEHADGDKAIAKRVLAQLGSSDPVATLINLFDQQKVDTMNGEIEEGNLLDALVKYSKDERVAQKLSAVSQTSESSFVRTRAINNLGRLGTKPALLALVELISAPVPTHLKTDLGWKGDSPDFASYLPKLAVNTLKAATHQNFGTDSTKWKNWIHLM